MSLLWIAVSVVLYALMSCQSALALEFTADQVIKIDGKTRKAYIYYRDAMWRIEHHTMGPVNVSIVRKDKQVVWLLLSRMKHFKTVPYSPEQDLMIKERLDGEISREEIGTEMREGHHTILYEVKTKQGERVDEYYQWLASDIHFPMKLAKKTVVGSWNITMSSCVQYQTISSTYRSTSSPWRDLTPRRLSRPVLDCNTTISVEREDGPCTH